MAAESVDPEVQRRLTELEEESDRRRAELAAVLDEIPAAVSRRDVIASGFRDLRSGHGQGSTIGQLVRSVVAVPRALVDRLRARRTQ